MKTLLRFDDPVSNTGLRLVQYEGSFAVYLVVVVGLHDNEQEFNFDPDNSLSKKVALHRALEDFNERVKRLLPTRPDDYAFNEFGGN